MIKDDHDNSHRRLRGVLGEFTGAIGSYLRLLGNLGVGAGSGKTKLDKFRLKMCKNQMVGVKMDFPFFSYTYLNAIHRIPPYQFGQMKVASLYNPLGGRYFFSICMLKH